MATPTKLPQQALTQLQTLQPILWGFNHRNKNQHRGACWWGSFGMLRRNLDKLVKELEIFVAAAQRQSNKKRKRPENEGTINAAETRARWMLQVLVPKLYISFSQLTADNQFATLGVVLIVALAQVNSACITLVGDIQPAEEASPKPAQVPADAQSNVSQKQPLESVVETDFVDMGQVVSREEFARSAVSRDTASEESKPKHRKQVSGDSTIEMQQDSSMVEKSGKMRAKPSKKKKKGKKGDEFDHLFKSLF